MFPDRYLSWLRQWLFPVPGTCWWCGQGPETPVCRLCLLAMTAGPAHRCSRCRRRLVTRPGERPSTRCGGCKVLPPAYAGVTSLGCYQGLCRWTIQAIKTQGERVLLEPLAGLLARQVIHDAGPVDAVVPMTSNAARIRRRGFDQALLLAEQVARHLQRPLLAGVLRRRPGAPPQSSLTGAARRQNALSLFTVKAWARRRIEGLRILVVDDVLSTGSSINSAAAALLAAGAVEVWAGVVADNISQRGIARVGRKAG